MPGSGSTLAFPPPRSDHGASPEAPGGGELGERGAARAPPQQAAAPPHPHANPGRSSHTNAARGREGTRSPARQSYEPAATALTHPGTASPGTATGSPSMSTSSSSAAAAMTPAPPISREKAGAPCRGLGLRGARAVSLSEAAPTAEAGAERWRWGRRGAQGQLRASRAPRVTSRVPAEGKGLNVRQGRESAGAEGRSAPRQREVGARPGRESRCLLLLQAAPLAVGWGSAPRGRPGLGAAVGTEARLAVRFGSLKGVEVRWSSGGLRSAQGGPGPVEVWWADRREALCRCIRLQMSVFLASVCVLPSMQSCLFVRLEDEGSRVLRGSS